MKLVKSTTSLLILTLSLPLTVFADVEFTEPGSGSMVQSGDILIAQWKDSGEYPILQELHDYDLFLCAGGPSVDYSEELALLVQNGLFERGNSVSFQIQPNLGPIYQNAYFLKMISRGVDNTTIVNYSQRFSVKGMTGTFSERVRHGLSLAMSDNGHIHQGLKKRQLVEDTEATDDEDVFYTVPYPEQTVWLTKYAPMGKRPGTTITAKSAPPQFPTSTYSVALTFLPLPTVQTTVTETRTWSTSGIENPATPAPHPKDDMELFLRRWADDE